MDREQKTLKEAREFAASFAQAHGLDEYMENDLQALIWDIRKNDAAEVRAECAEILDRRARFYSKSGLVNAKKWTEQDAEEIRQLNSEHQPAEKGE